MQDLLGAVSTKKIGQVQVAQIFFRLQFYVHKRKVIKDKQRKTMPGSYPTKLKRDNCYKKMQQNDPRYNREVSITFNKDIDEAKHHDAFTNKNTG